MQRESDLLTRSYSGVEVSLGYLPLMAMSTVHVTVGDETRVATWSEDVFPDARARALDAYRHPAVYVPGVADLLCPPRAQEVPEVAEA